jgi:hypothetical protein
MLHAQEAATADLCILNIIESSVRVHARKLTYQREPTSDLTHRFKSLKRPMKIELHYLLIVNVYNTGYSSTFVGINCAGVHFSRSESHCHPDRSKRITRTNL